MLARPIWPCAACARANRLGWRGAPGKARPGSRCAFPCSVLISGRGAFQSRRGNSGSLRMPTVGAMVMLDRLGPKRSDADFLKSKLEAPGSRFLVLADLKPVIRSNPQRTEAKLAWFSREDLIEFGLPVAESLFLGVERTAAARGYFALAVTEHRTRNVPGAIEKLRPIVDLRSPAMQGIMSPEELSLC